MSQSAESICIAGLRGGSGKTVLSVGLIAAWHAEGLRVATFKKGPDFIDSGWLSFAAGTPCRNLDQFMMSHDQIADSFSKHSAGADIAIVEGNRGLYDGLDPQGQCSTAELAKLLDLPVILVVDVTMSTRTVAALIKGCRIFDPQLHMGGVILNRVAGSRQENLVRETVEDYCAVPVVGAVPKLSGGPFPERHMGLVPHLEQRHALEAVRWAREMVSKYLDLPAIRKIAAGEDLKPAASVSSPLLIPGSRLRPVGSISCRKRVRVGVVRDSVFWFYYPENLEALIRAGADLVEINSLEDRALPAVDALYIGGGFPETQPERLASNAGFLKSVRDGALAGLPIYAECGGFIYLGRNLQVQDRIYPMAGALPVDFILRNKPQGHGYTVLETVEPNPYFSVRDIIKGHEFHYSDPVIACDKDVKFVFKVIRGHGIDGRRDGMCLGNMMGVYTHIHAAGDEAWASAVVEAARSGERPALAVKC